jgi:hypothetical protein
MRTRYKCEECGKACSYNYTVGRPRTFCSQKCRRDNANRRVREKMRRLAKAGACPRCGEDRLKRFKTGGYPPTRRVDCKACNTINSTHQREWAARNPKEAKSRQAVTREVRVANGKTAAYHKRYGAAHK